MRGALEIRKYNTIQHNTTVRPIGPTVGRAGLVQASGRFGQHRYRGACTQIPTDIAVHKFLKHILCMFSSIIQLILLLKHISIPHPASTY